MIVDDVAIYESDLRCCDIRKIYGQMSEEVSRWTAIFSWGVEMGRRRKRYFSSRNSPFRVSIASLLRDANSGTNWLKNKSKAWEEHVYADQLGRRSSQEHNLSHSLELWELERPCYMDWIRKTNLSASWGWVWVRVRMVIGIVVSLVNLKYSHEVCRCRRTRRGVRRRRVFSHRLQVTWLPSVVNL